MPEHGGRSAHDLRATAHAKRRYDRNARFYHYADRQIRREWRLLALAEARGAVLELGVGTGGNLPLYDPHEVSRVTGVDFSAAMLAGAYGRTPSVPCDLRLMDVQALEFPDQSFDTVLATCVFCTVPDPLQGLREARRVVRPDGRVVLLEHVRVPGALGCLQDVLNPLTLWLMGENINRRTLDYVRMAGLLPERVDEVAGGLVQLIVAKPPPRSRGELML